MEGRRESGLGILFEPLICGLVFCSVRFGCGKVLVGGWASGPWIFDAVAEGFYARRGSGLMDFVAGFVPDGQQFLGDDGLGLVGEISI